MSRNQKQVLLAGEGGCSLGGSAVHCRAIEEVVPVRGSRQTPARQRRVRMEDEWGLHVGNKNRKNQPAAWQAVMLGCRRAGRRLHNGQRRNRNSVQT